jgi:ABC-type branched-subunit amino acid transport system ATPase component/ABC-type branched-subunit amino acid transport system permease subunit
VTGLAALFYLAPQIGGGKAFQLGEYEVVLSFVMVAVALNLAVGYAGQFLLGITAVFACGAYGAALVVKHHPAGVGLLVMCLIGLGVGAVGGLVIGLPSLRIGGFYLALVSLFATLAVPQVAQQWSFAGGEAGIPLFAVLGFAPKIAGETLYAIIVTATILLTLLSWAIVNSRVGHRLVLLGTSEQLAENLGVSVFRTKLLTILISSSIAGAAGGVYVYSQQFFAPTSTSAGLAILLIAAIVIGGMGTITGPLVGGAIVLGINQFFTAFQTYNGFVFGALLLVFAIFLPKGLLERVRTGASWFTIRHPARPDTPRVAPKDPVRLPVRKWESWLPDDSEGSVEVVGARRSFGGVLAVSDVDLTLRPGTVHGLIGSNGSGKTTLLNLICGFYRLDAGAVRLDGAPMGTRPHIVTRRGIARTFQTPKLMPQATVLENVVPAAELRIPVSGPESVLRLPRGVKADRESRDRATAALEVLGLQGLRDELAEHLPHGTRRMVELARAIAMTPKYLLLDEPAAGLSEPELELLVGTIRQLADFGVGVLLIEHNVPTVLEIAREVTVLHQGSRIFHGSPADLVTDAAVAEAFLGVDFKDVGRQL